MSIDWGALESQLFDLVVREVRTFSAKHPNERFCNFFIDCNADYGEIFLCLNTPGHLAKMDE